MTPEETSNTPLKLVGAACGGIGGAIIGIKIGTLITAPLVTVFVAMVYPPLVPIAYAVMVGATTVAAGALFAKKGYEDPVSGVIGGVAAAAGVLLTTPVHHF